MDPSNTAHTPTRAPEPQQECALEGGPQMAQSSGIQSNGILRHCAITDSLPSLTAHTAMRRGVLVSGDNEGRAKQSTRPIHVPVAELLRLRPSSSTHTPTRRQEG